MTAATSRAMPSSERQSARLGVSFSVISVSSRASASRTLAPTRASAGSESSPEASSAIPSSLAEHSIPCDSTPRITVVLIAGPPGSSAPTSAQGAFMPATALGAPQTIVRRAPVPASTVHTRRRSALGCGSTFSIFATTTPEKGGAAGTASSTSRPAIVNRSHSPAESSGGSTSVRSQRSENLIASSPHANCLRKPRSFS